MITGAYMDDLENLLNLHGEVFALDNGYWVKFEAYEVNPTNAIPHGVRYSLTLHNKKGNRVLGYDNAHSFKTSQKFKAKKLSYDHVHKKTDVFPYEFESASTLMQDFWRSVEFYMEQYE